MLSPVAPPGRSTQTQTPEGRPARAQSQHALALRASGAPAEQKWGDGGGTIADDISRCHAVPSGLHRDCAAIEEECAVLSPSTGKQAGKRHAHHTTAQQTPPHLVVQQRQLAADLLGHKVAAGTDELPALQAGRQGQGQDAILLVFCVERRVGRLSSGQPAAGRERSEAAAAPAASSTHPSVPSSRIPAGRRRGCTSAAPPCCAGAPSARL